MESGRILIADDCPVFRDGLRRMVERGVIGLALAAGADGLVAKSLPPKGIASAKWGRSGAIGQIGTIQTWRYHSRALRDWRI